MKNFFKAVGMLVIVGIMTFNVMFTGKEDSSAMSLLSLGRVAIAQSESGTCCIGSNFQVTSIPGGWRCDNDRGNSCCPVC